MIKPVFESLLVCEENAHTLGTCFIGNVVQVVICDYHNKEGDNMRRTLVSVIWISFLN